ncbi:hypothetical protein OKW76_07155 [Sphingomonas sp. S1-29]|uniref:hypothetical protein n=1 Tax=Sphingomonas sp. S1-29 TaxID=2991074 RepID=UPI00223E9EC6|nr:hypothetical protein [Sphingomonas sp. S1-29]UZK70793.1 hypothetical protein OKW76_07155 [Sphingomonas sp. S1-29]
MSFFVANLGQRLYLVVNRNDWIQMMTQKDDWISSSEAQRILDVSDEYLATAARNGHIETGRLKNATTGRPSRNVRYRKLDVLGMMISKELQRCER